MSHALSYSCLAQQHAELLPARTVLSIFAQGPGDGQGSGNLGDAVRTMLGFSQGGNSTPGPDGSDGNPQPNG